MEAYNLSRMAATDTALESSLSVPLKSLSWDSVEDDSGDWLVGWHAGTGGGYGYPS